MLHNPGIGGDSRTFQKADGRDVRVRFVAITSEASKLWCRLFLKLYFSTKFLVALE
jgi:hypothetical protein